MKTFPKLVLLAVASVTFVFGITSAIIFFPTDETSQTQAKEASAEVPVDWKTSFAEGSALAKEQHKYVLADVYTDWCGWCKKLDKTVFSNAKVVDYLSKEFVCVKVNAEDPKEGQAVASAHNVNGYPCALVFSPEGKMIGRIDGYEAPRAYVSTLKEIIAGGGKAAQ